MAKITLTKIEGTIEADAGTALTWLLKEGVKISQGGPKAIAALGVLLTAVEAELAAAGSGNLAAAIQDISPAWADLKAFVADFGIKL
jgi:hypothetical protein